VAHRRSRDLIEGMHPPGQVVEILAVAVPLQLLVEGIARSALGQPLADPQTAASGMGLALTLAQPTDPPDPRIVAPLPSERVMDPLDQSRGQLRVARVPRRTRQAEEVAHREGVRPEVTSLGALRGEAGAVGKGVMSATASSVRGSDMSVDSVCALTAHASSSTPATRCGNPIGVRSSSRGSQPACPLSRS